MTRSDWPEPGAFAEALDLAALTPAAQLFVKAIETRPDLPIRLARMALMFRAREKSREQKSDAIKLARAAQRMAPGNHQVRALTDWLTRREAPLWHFRIIHDKIRNETYARALDHFVKPGMIAFEIGTGTGILAMLAARAGAAHVYTCERRADVAQAARAIIERNGLSDRITVIAKDANDVHLGKDLPERADLFVAEIVDNALLGEDVLPLTELARAKFLKPDALLLPREISAVGYLIGGQGHAERYRVDRVMDFDMTPFNRFTPVELNAGPGGGEVEQLTAAAVLSHFDLRLDALPEGSRRVTFTADRPGRAESLLRWLKLDFGDGIMFENRPPQMSAWDPQLHVLPDYPLLAVGETLELEIRHDRRRLFIASVGAVQPTDARKNPPQ